MAAVLAAGPGAVLSHRSASALWRIRDTAPAKPEVIVARERRRPGIHIHRVALPADEMTVARGIPVTTPTRTLLDLAEVISFHQLERAVHETEFRRLTSPLSLDALLARHAGRRGTTALREIVNCRNLGRNIPRSDLEIAFLAFVDKQGLERPLVNEKIGPYTVDALYPDARLVIELDSRSPTRPRGPSRKTADETATCSRRATASCGSPTASSTRSTRRSQHSSDRSPPRDR